ncbi:multinuclear nonheme iron-dependent oxidase [Streptomyces odontomachi]|uniref:multinuclear nonheme iron-dependent oxidase n=1 Tax=Streptomyces odontomachi TaxID=2944940 RepID=UPI0021098277|nr:DUF692 family multinuclear iron-containing protein [Streptomyces sp. ODS25]
MVSGAALPKLGSGFGYRPQWAPELRRRPEASDWVEWIIESCLDIPDDLLRDVRSLRRGVQVVPHSVEPPIAEPGSVDRTQLRACAGLVSDMAAPWLSGHLHFTDDARAAAADPERMRSLACGLGRRAAQVQRAVGVPFLLENLTYAVGAVPQFVTEVLEHCDCGLMVNLGLLSRAADESGFEPMEFLAAVPLERMAEVHLSAGVAQPGTAIHRHPGSVTDHVWELLEELTSLVSLPATVVERDPHRPGDLSEALSDVSRARRVLAAAGDDRESRMRA